MGDRADEWFHNLGVPRAKACKEELVPIGKREAQPGDVYQILERHGRAGWVGAFVMATEIKSWGIQGFVHRIATHDEMGQVFIRLKWDELAYIGHAELVLGEST